MSKEPGSLIDLSHTIEHGLITYKGLPAPLICDYLSREASQQFYDEQTSFQIGKIEMVANTGTYLDAPFHRYESGKDLAELNLSSLANLEGVIISVPAEIKKIGTEYFQGLDLQGKAVLVHTGWDTHWNTEQYFENHPFLSKSAAQFLQESQVTLVGIDSYNIDDVNDRSRPVHSILLHSEIPIVEHLCNLQSLQEANFLFSAVPVKIKKMGTFPVRAFATLT